MTIIDFESPVNCYHFISLKLILYTILKNLCNMMRVFIWIVNNKSDINYLNNNFNNCQACSFIACIFSTINRLKKKLSWDMLIKKILLNEIWVHRFSLHKFYFKYTVFYSRLYVIKIQSCSIKTLTKLIIYSEVTPFMYLTVNTGMGQKITVPLRIKTSC